MSADGGNLYAGPGIQIYGDDLNGPDESGNDGTNAVGSVNGVSFELNTGAALLDTPDSTTVRETALRNTGGSGQTNPNPTYITDATLEAVVDDINWNNLGALTLEFTGLSSGTSYVAQFITWDAAVEGASNGNLDRDTVVSSDIDGETYDYAQIIVDDGATSDEILPVLVTAEFVATGSSATFSFIGTELAVGSDPDSTLNIASVLNAATLFVIPEPTSLALVAFGSLSLLRRRR